MIRSRLAQVQLRVNMCKLAQSYFTEITIPQQKSYDEKTLFPSVLSPTTHADVSVLMTKIKEHKPWLESIFEKTGALLLRGFPVETASDFNDLVEAFGYEEMDYVGGLQSRIHIVGRVSTASEWPPSHEISYHHEMSYLSNFPSKVYFFCEVEPRKGGETPIVLSHIVYEKMKDKYPDFVKTLETRGVKIYTTLTGKEFVGRSPIGRGWESTFSTNDKNIAEERAAELGMKLEWQENGVKTVRGPIPAIKVDERRNRKIWFNNILTAYMARKGHNPSNFQVFTYGDGTPIPEEMIEESLKVHEEESVAIPWRKGDVLLLDNLAVLHARRTFDPPRRILASLCK